MTLANDCTFRSSLDLDGPGSCGFWGLSSCAPQKSGEGGNQ